MAFFRPSVSREAEVRYHADQEVGKSFPEFLEKARAAEAELRRVQATSTSAEERRAAGRAFDVALTEALRAAEVGRLRTLREQNRLTGIARVPRPVALAAR